MGYSLDFGNAKCRTAFLTQKLLMQLLGTFLLFWVNILSH